MWLVILTGGLYLAYQGLMYVQVRDLMPQGTMVAGVDVSGLSVEETAETVLNRYMSPVAVYYRDERIEISPEQIGFTINMEQMIQQIQHQQAQKTWWQGYLEYIIGRSLQPVEIPLQATHDRNALLDQLQTIADFLDQPARPPHLLTESETFELGQPGYVADVNASLAEVEAAFYRPDNREAHMVIIDQPAPPLDMNLLADVINKLLDSFDGVGSIFIMDLQTGEELAINADIALSGLSIMKIPILLETYRALDFEPTPNQRDLILGTMVYSGNYSANLLLDVVAGQDNAYLGVDILTESMHRLGLQNTFIVTPYEEPNRPGKTTMATPANSRQDIWTDPDPAMQTTAEDMGTLLSMIYYCSKGGGALLAVYPDQVTPEECQEMIDVMTLNTEGNLIRFGVPEDVPVAHKHGWGGNTHGDAGIVFSPGGDYVIVEYLTMPGSDWLVYDISFPILREISRATYNYFNFDNPNLETPEERALREAARIQAEQAQQEQANDAETTTDSGQDQ